MNQVFRIAATGLSMNYMPEYVAQEQGFFAEQRLIVESYVPSPWTQCLTDVDKQDADVVVGGIWLPLIYMDRIANYYSFAKIASRCPLVIVSRQKIAEPLNWRAMEHKRVLVSGGDGASHYLSVAGCAKEGGAEIQKIRFIHDFSTSMIIDMFLGGFGDFIVLQPDMANKFIADGRAYLYCDLSRHGGIIPWSVYYGTEALFNHPDNLAGRFYQALQKATTWLLENGGKGCKSIIERNWPHVKLADGIATIDRFCQIGMWTPSIEITEQELTRWQGFLVEGDILDKPLDYRKVVKKVI
ncbi:NitT/TauT family transport system substrate-binding protein [Orbus hercynius]|uniref:Thiamine pyrimidine synthase n=1 Tax=Orbus hercynius TaxID=593135 RepID=A0A495RIV4_9GAMM|nr:ABC transporter substrate-binding protein [Orbus hercynius]RKS87462.1 NitT/TauT family transport system substrate-binding protein [Orbus hercynius]